MLFLPFTDNEWIVNGANHSSPARCSVLPHGIESMRPRGKTFALTRMSCKNIYPSQEILDRCGIVSIDGSPDEAHYSFQGSGNGGISSLIAMAVSILLRRGQSISFAESFTGGMLSDLWHGEGDVGRVLLGTVVISGVNASWSALEISEIFLGNFGQCSGEVAVAMANGVREVFLSDFSIAIAGGCGRMAYVSIRTPTRKIVQRVDLSQASSSRELMRERACYAACKIFFQVLFEEPL